MKIEPEILAGPTVSFFESVTDKPGKTLEIAEVFAIIRTGKGIKKAIESIRKEADKSNADNIKKTLPAITPSGVFVASRRLQNLNDYSGIICVDFDNVSEPETKKLILAADPYCYTVFISPSGRGLKVFVKVKRDQNNHRFFYNTLSQYFKQKYDLVADKSCKDLTRLMFLSYDKEIIINEKAKMWCKEPGDEFNFDLIQDTIGFKKLFHEGNRNNSVFFLASTCCKEGISKEYTEMAIVRQLATADFNKMEILKVVNSAYKSEGNVSNKMPILKNNGLSLLSRVEEYINSKYDIRFNIVSTKIEWKRKEPGASFQELNENTLHRELQHAHLNLSLAKLASLMLSDFVATYNPFLDYFETLGPWDKTEDPDYISKLCDYIPAVDKDRFRRHFKKMLVRSVACALNDRVFNKQVFVLVHDVQNSGKSTFCRWLCPPALFNYITENINTDKDSSIALATNFLINMDELATLTRAEINSLKSFISRDKINVRLPFAKKAIVMPRRANFVGSTNKDEFLTDETGSVRWLCFALSGMINFAYTEEIDINDIWRQAHTLYKGGFEYQLTPDEIIENEKANDTFQILSMEMQLIPKMFAPSSKEEGGIFLTSTDIHLNLNSQFANSKTNIHNIGRAMRRLGFSKINQYSESKGYTEKGYFIKLLTNHTTQLLD